MRNWTLDLRPFSGNLELVGKLAALRDARIAEMLTDTASLEYKTGQFVKGALFGDPGAARWCRENKIPLMKASATSPNASGGTLVPEDVVAAVLLLTDTYGITRQEATVWRLNSDTLLVPRNTVGMTMGWVGETSTISATTPSFDSLQLTARKLAGYLKVSNELMEDATALGAWFIKAAAQGMAKAEDQAAFVGDGSSTYGGVVGIQSALASSAKVTAASGHNSYQTLDSTDIGAAIAALPARALPNAKLYVSVTGYGSTLVRLAGANGGLVATIENGKLVANYHGLPVVITSALPTSTGTLSGKMLAVVGDLSQAVALAARKDLSVQAFGEFAAELDETLIRMTERVDIVAHDTGNAGDGSAVIGLFAP
jgi:HK97 family phage major capsid protein